MYIGLYITTIHEENNSNLCIPIRTTVFVLQILCTEQFFQTIDNTQAYLCSNENVFAIRVNTDKTYSHTTSQALFALRFVFEFRSIFHSVFRKFGASKRRYERGVS